MPNDINNLGGVTPQGQSPPKRTESPPGDSKEKPRPVASKMEGRRQLADDTIEISGKARKELQQAQASKVEDEKLANSDLEFTGQRFYTLGLNIINREAIQPPSEPEIKE